MFLLTDFDLMVHQRHAKYIILSLCGHTQDLSAGALSWAS